MRILSINRYRQFKLMLFVFLSYSIYSFGQASSRFQNRTIQINKYFDINSLPFLNTIQLLKPEFKWDMKAQTQVAMNEGLNYLNDGSIDLAITQFSEAIKTDSLFWPAYYYRGCALRNIRKLNDGEKDIKTALKLNPSQWESHIVLGEIYEAKKDFGKAESEYKKASKIGTTQPYGIYKLGNLELQKKQPQKAEEFYLKCNEIKPEFPDAYLAIGVVKIIEGKPPTDYITYFQKSLQIDSSYLAGYFWAGYSHLQIKEIEACEKDWTNLLRRNPTNPFLMFMLGFLNIELEDFDQAFSYFRKGLLITQNRFQTGQTIFDNGTDLRFAANYMIKRGYGLDETVFYNLKKSFCLLLAGKKNEALQSVKEARKFDESALVVFMQALIYDHLGEVNASQEYYSKTIELDKDVFYAYKKRSIARMNLNDWTGADEDFKEMLRIEPGSETVYQLRGMSRYLNKKYDEAIVDFTKYLNTDSLNYEIILKRAECEKAVGKFSESNTDYKKILKSRYPINTFDISRRIIDNCLAAHDTLGAISFYQEILKHNDINFQLHSELGELYCLTKQFSLLKKEIGKMKEIFWLSPLMKSYIRFLRGLRPYVKGRYSDAIFEFTNTLSIDFVNHPAQYYRAKAYIKLGKYQEAIADLKQLKDSNFRDSGEIFNKLTNSKTD